MAVLDDLVVAHQLAGPLDDADADAAAAPGPGRCPSARLEAPKPRITAGSSPIVEDEVGDAEQQREDRREAEQRRRPGARRASRGLVDVGRARLVLGQPRVGDRVGLDGGRASCLSTLMPCAFFFVERVELAAIQTATPTRPPMPTSQANRPSETGPSEPSVKPPYVGRLLVLLQVGDDLALVLGGEHLVGEDRHLLRAGEHGLVDVLLRDAVQRRGEAAAGQRAAGAGEVVARRAVGAEELAAADDVLVRRRRRRRTRTRPGRGAGAERGDVRRQRLDLLLRRRPGACAAPGCRAGPSASGRCRPGSRPRRRRRRSARGRTGRP